MLSELGISKKQVLTYALLPGFWPRIRDLAGSGFHPLARMIAMVFYVVRILPRTHPYVRDGRRTRFGIRHVIAEAANHIVLDRKNIDQIVIFIAVLTGLILLVLQFGLMIAAIIINPALAAPGDSGYDSFFKTPDPKEDIAFRFLNMVFGFKDIFGTGVTVTPFHQALHALFSFYSYGILLVGLLIVLYHVLSVVAETAKTGVPFGERFNHAWAPVRLILFLGCLIPLGTNGVNLGQWFTLTAAKLGSGLATNGWLTFNEKLSETALGNTDTLVGTPNAPEMMYLTAFMMVSKTCAIAHKGMTGEEVDAYIVSGTPGMDASGNVTNVTKLGTGGVLPMIENNGGQIVIVLGTMRKSAEGKVSVDPVCGQIEIQPADASQPGPAAMQWGYVNLVKKMWSGAAPYSIEEKAQAYIRNYLPSVFTGEQVVVAEPDDSYRKAVTKALDEEMKNLVNQAVGAQKSSESWALDRGVEKKGWGAAGIWYNKVAEMNGSLVTAVHSTPRIALLPRVLEEIKKQKSGQDRQIVADDFCVPKLANGTPINFTNDTDNAVAKPLTKVCSFWVKDGFRGDDLATKTNMTGNPILDAINMIFGTQGIFNLCKNTDVHPLAQLSMAGRGLIESSIAAFGGSIFFGAAGALSKSLGELFQGSLFAMSKFFVTVAGVGLMAGFVLFYVVPFMPFIYFFFALGSWVKAIFEAMVGIPLWLVGHLSLDGDGMMGNDAEGGYFMIFEIFIRPIMILFGLVASITIFAALVRVLNQIFYLVISNMSGHSPTDTSGCFQSPDAAGGAAASASDSAKTPGNYLRGTVDEFFYTIVYAIVVYMIGLSCFKMIDLIPSNVMRWLGAGVDAFGDKGSDPAQEMMTRVTVGGGAVGSEIGRGIGGSAGGIMESIFGD